SQRKPEVAAVDPGEQLVGAKPGREDETLGQALAGGGVDRDQAPPAADPVDRRALLDWHVGGTEPRQQRRRDRRDVEKAGFDVEPAEIDVELRKAGAEPLAVESFRLEVQALEDPVTLFGVRLRESGCHARFGEVQAPAFDEEGLAGFALEIEPEL